MPEILLWPAVSMKALLRYSTRFSLRTNAGLLMMVIRPNGVESFEHPVGKGGIVAEIKRHGCFGPDNQMGIGPGYPVGQGNVLIDGGELKGRVPFHLLADVALDNGNLFGRCSRNRLYRCVQSAIFRSPTPVKR